MSLRLNQTPQLSILSAYQHLFPGGNLNKVLYKITVTNWSKYNSTKKKGHRNFMLSAGFLSDAKIRCLTPTQVILFLQILCLCAEENSGCVTTDPPLLRRCTATRRGLFTHNISVLEQLQLLTVEKIDVLINRIEEKRKEKKTTTKDLGIIPVHSEEAAVEKMPKEKAEHKIKATSLDKIAAKHKSKQADIDLIIRMTEEKFGNRIAQHASEVFSHFGSAENFFDWLVDIERGYDQKPRQMGLISWVELLMKKKIGVLK